MKVGDRVKVINAGKTYNIYEDFAKEHSATNWVRGCWLSVGDEFTVSVISEHLDHPTKSLVCLVTSDDGRQTIIGSDGLAVISPDLTKINKPFGELNRSVQVALFESWLDGSVILFEVPEYPEHLMVVASPSWDDGSIYRVKPRSNNSSEITKIRKEMEKLTERLEELEV